MNKEDYPCQHKHRWKVKVEVLENPVYEEGFKKILTKTYPVEICSDCMMVVNWSHYINYPPELIVKGHKTNFS